MYSNRAKWQVLEVDLICIPEAPRRVLLRGNDRHFFKREFEVEDFEVLFHALDVARLRKGKHAELDEPPQAHLRVRFSITRADLCDHFVCKGLAASKRAPRFNYQVALKAVLERFCLNAPRIELDLIDHRFDLGMLQERFDVMRFEVRKPDLH